MCSRRFTCLVRSGMLLTSLALVGCDTSSDRIVFRIATFNASLFRDTLGALVGDLQSRANTQARTVAEIIQRVRPDILLVNEFDYDAAGEAARLFQQNYLAIGQNVSGRPDPAQPVTFAYRYAAPVNTGVPSGLDLDNDGIVGTEGNRYAGDALGFGRFPGQYGMLLLSRFPIDTAGARTFRNFRWKDMADAMLPVDSNTGEPWYSEAELEALPLSSKSHWDLPIRIGPNVIHVLASHPTPPVFDGPEDRNGRRNHDEIRFWADYVSPNTAAYAYDDDGTPGGLRDGAPFVILGDLNADPHDGDATNLPMRLLLENPRIDGRVTPASEGAQEQARLQGAVNDEHHGNPAFDTADFADRGNGPGNLRLDYVLPSAGLEVRGAGVFWPLSVDPLFRLVGTFPFPASEHRLVWLDVGW